MAEGMVRELDLEDYADLLDLWKRAGLHSLKPRGRDSIDAIGRQLDSGVQTILGVKIDERLVGAVVATHDSRKGWINRLAVDPAYRRRGYGARLVRAAEEVLHNQGIHIIAALVEGDNRASLALFERCGYAVSSDIHLREQAGQRQSMNRLRGEALHRSYQVLQQSLLFYGEDRTGIQHQLVVLDAGNDGGIGFSKGPRQLIWML